LKLFQALFNINGQKGLIVQQKRNTSLCLFT